MERFSPPPLEQTRTRGVYERRQTDTARLSAELTASRELERLATDFDKGVTPLRDVGRMIAVQRGAILNAYHSGAISSMVVSHPELLFTPVANLHSRVVSGRRDQPIGHNFL